MEQTEGSIADSDQKDGRSPDGGKGNIKIGGRQVSLDQWQSDILKHSGRNIALRSGRQVGKSTIISVMAGEWALTHPRNSIMIISATERQAYLLFSKVLGYLVDNFKAYIKTGKDRPTKSEIKLKNGSIIRCLPTGLDGIGIRGYTVDGLIADEAHFIPEDVWQAVTPMLATTKGWQVLLSTPHGREGYFYRCFNDPSFTTFHISSEECPRIDKDFLAREKETMSKLEYTQEYLGEFVDNLLQFFPDPIIKACMTLTKPDNIKQADYFLGVDVARMGGDESTFEVMELSRSKRLYHRDSVVTKNTLLTDTIQQILHMDRMYGFKKIYIDDGGLGVGVFDHLLEHEQTKRKVVAINNARRAIEHSWEKPRKTRLMKEDLYTNLLRLMERGEVFLLQNDEVFQSLKSVQFEYTDRGEMRIFGNDTHIAEGLIRATWCVKDKGLNIWLSYF